MNEKQASEMDIGQMGVHIAYMREGIDELKSSMRQIKESSPTKAEMAEVKVQVMSLRSDVDSLKGDRKYILGAASIIVFLWGALWIWGGKIIDSTVRDILAEYEITIK